MRKRVGRRVFAGDRLADQLRERGYTNEAFARLLGISPAAVSMFRHGRRQPSVSTLVDMAQLLHVSPGWLLGLDEEVGK